MISSDICKKLPLRQLQENLGGFVDVLVCSASFETRCLSVPQSLNPNEVGAVHVLVNEDVLGNGNQHANMILDRFPAKASRVTISKSNPVIVADKIVRMLSELEIRRGGNLLIDISTLTHETMLILFRLVREIDPDEVDVRFVYTDAKEYDPGTPEEEKWLSLGISDIRSVLGYPGEMRPSRKHHLIVLVGYEDERTGKLIEMFEPSALSLGIGDKEPINEEIFNASRTYFSRLVEVGRRFIRFSFSPTDILATRDAILERACLFPEHNVIVAPMNTKISALGAALAAIQNPEIQICYGSAITYNVENYSEPADVCRLISMSAIESS